MKIPIENVFYMLCYSWNVVEPGDVTQFTKSDYKTLYGLFARILNQQAKRLISRGLDRNYVPHTAQYKGVKGKMHLSASIKTNSFLSNSAVCEFDEFEFDSRLNRILKSTLYGCTRSSELPKDLKEDLRRSYLNMHHVSLVELVRDDFRKVRFDRNNRRYELAIRICQMIFESRTLDEQQGRFKFLDFREDEKKMNVLYENFVRNFYRQELQGYRANREYIQWNATEIESQVGVRLPAMETDVTIQNSKSKVIVECKYTARSIVSRKEDHMFNSQHLYQLSSYLRNQTRSDPKSQMCSGVLLYPQVANPIRAKYIVDGHSLSVCTVNLFDSWKNIDKELREIVRPYLH